MYYEPERGWGSLLFKSLPLKDHDFRGRLLTNFLNLESDHNSNKYKTKFLPRISRQKISDVFAIPL